jgi:mono/diheme cytochrome c family protein
LIAGEQASAMNAATTKQVCADDNGGLILRPGFCATVFADRIGHARHLVVAPNGVVYVNTWSGRYYGNDTPPPDSSSRCTTPRERAGPMSSNGSVTACRLAVPEARESRSNGARSFAEVNDRIVRYALPTSGIVPTEAPTVILSGLPLTADHPMHPFVIDARGAMYVTAPAQRVGPPEGIHPTAGANAAGLPTPKGATAEMVAQGDRLFHANSCVGCHGPDAKGSPVGSDLTSGIWLWGDGSLAAIARTITQGVPHPKEHTGVTPPMGGAQLSPSDVRALAAYIAALNQRGDR